MCLKKFKWSFLLWNLAVLFLNSKSSLALVPYNKERVTQQARSTSRKPCRWWSRGWSAATATSATPTVSTRWSSRPTRTCGVCSRRRRRTRTSWRAPRSWWRAACKACSFNVSTQLWHAHALARQDDGTTEFSLLVCKNEVAEGSIDEACEMSSFVVTAWWENHEAALKEQVYYVWL